MKKSYESTWPSLNLEGLIVNYVEVFSDDDLAEDIEIKIHYDIANLHDCTCRFEYELVGLSEAGDLVWNLEQEETLKGDEYLGIELLRLELERAQFQRIKEWSVILNWREEIEV